ncbi:MAG: acetolactate synthase 3 large subunit [Rhodospirillaceae bacterium]|jgi:acetolactate synthase-1/2/3 large subunit|nr:acetolactate synthase 3 large subunit [Rhodospirillaceae bacterium]MBT4699854.1 acetolactate synthase 3 large subunit [Rhodospirillaceae bacterium]MBT5036477.1 acetolactate synthase 3 large subunit [Rhodospirillaceae bacterium]MBT6219497.1 acetolactate synthase 3 large subunit [Rhodospirillaceae bacterium]MBT6363799.1 acetolactate synthase 3 large subunit [Rhodospirillaceae bacterium]
MSNELSDEQYNGATILIKALVDQGVDTVFGYPGGAVLPIYDAIFKQNKLRHILVRHEQGAMHAAEGYARSSGKVGCVLVTSGPGGTNAVTGLCDAMSDSIPVVCITGQVPTHLIGNDAFQEADITGITRPCTKHNYLVKDVDSLAETVHEAFYVARSGRPGPVLIDFPKDVMNATGDYTPPLDVEHKTYKPQMDGDSALIREAVKMLKAAKKPIIYAGGGVINSGPHASELLTELVRLTGAPCTLTLMGLGAFPASDKQFVGMLGMHGTYESNLAMHDCDVMLAVGSRFDDRITGRLDQFSPGSKKIHIDIDPSSVNKNVAVDLPIIGDVGSVLTDMVEAWKADPTEQDKTAIEDWWVEINTWRKKDCLKFDENSGLIKPQYAIQRLYEMTKDREDVFITTEVGQHQMWAAQFYHFDKPNHWMTSGGLGTMGYGLPAAMGVQVAHPEALVVDIAGEASTLMNIQEMSTIAQCKLPVKVFILNNQYLGMVRQWQELLHGGRYAESYMDSLPDFVKLAEAFQAEGLRATKLDELDDVIKAMIDSDKAVIADICVDPAENVFPMIPSGAAHNEMLLGPEDKAEQPISEEGMVLV